jgi:hypothetical protein
MVRRGEKEQVVPEFKTAAPGRKPAAKPTPKPQEAEVLYPALYTVVHQAEDKPREDDQRYAPPMTVDGMKELLGWSEKGTGAPLFKDVNGKNVWLTNNRGNRPFDRRWALELAMVHLKGKWCLNGDALIIGRTGRVLSAQHRGAGFVMAEQLRQKRPDTWGEQWPDELTMECIITYGVSEDTSVTRTHDNVKPRSLSDILFADEVAYPGLLESHRRQLCRITEAAIYMLRHRTGVKNARLPRRTHGEGVDFLNLHPTLRQAVKHIWEENSARAPAKSKGEKQKGEPRVNNPLSNIMPPGTAAALLYLMGSCKSDGDAYRALMRQGIAEESNLDWSMMGNACEFWSKVCDTTSRVPPLMELRHAIAALNNANTGEAGGTLEERVALIIKAWNLWSNGRKLTTAALKLNYVTVPDVGVVLNDTPLIEGLDVGRPDEEATSPAEPVAGDDEGGGEAEDQNDEEAAPPPEPADEDPATDLSEAEAGVADAEALESSEHDAAMFNIPPEEIARRAAEVRGMTPAKLEEHRGKVREDLLARRKNRQAAEANGQADEPADPPDAEPEAPKKRTRKKK